MSQEVALISWSESTPCGYARESFIKTIYAIERVEWKKKVAIVSRAPAGKVPLWGGLSPHFIDEADS